MKPFVVCGFAIASIAMAQTAPSTGPKGPGGGSTNPGGVTGIPSTTRSTTSSTTQTPDLGQSMNRLTFVTGRVVLEDGSAPPEPVLIERVCGTLRRYEARTDLKGHFSFQVGGQATPEVITDVSNDGFSNRAGLGDPNRPSVGGGAGGGVNRMNNPSSLQGCELRAALPGYRSSVVNLGLHVGMENPDVGLMVLKRLGDREGDTISMTNALAPKDAKKAYDKSRQLIAKGNTNDAKKELAKAVDIYPKYASAWAELGRLQMDSNEPAEARKSFQKAVEADAKYLPPYERLSVLALRDRNWQDLIDLTDKVIKLNAFDYPQVYYYNALGNLNLAHSEAAEKSARAALKQDPQKFVRANYIVGLALAQRGEFTSAADQLRAYIDAEPAAPEIEMVKKQLADIEKRASEQTAGRREQ